MDCVNSFDVDTEDCLEQCEGTITDIYKLNIDKNEDGLETLLRDYERFKLSINLTYPSIGHGTVFTMLPSILTESVPKPTNKSQYKT